MTATTGPASGETAAAPPGEPPGGVDTPGRADRPTPRVSAGLAVLLVAGVSSLVLASVIALLPVPYVIFSPGPVRDTLGTQGDGEDLIRIDGAETFETSGTLSLTTISVTGGPLGDLSIADVVQAWFDPERSVRPVETVYPAERTREEAEEQSTAEMESAQQAAAVAALSAAGVEVPVELTVRQVTDGVPAEDVVAEGDVLAAVDDDDLAGSGELLELIQARSPGDVVTLTLDRDGQSVEEDVELTESDGRTVIGVVIEPTYELPFEVEYDVGGIGGPSAGLVFALGIYDKITEGELTGGESIAGTGTISEDGLVGPIDGVQQKMVGARAAGAAWFLAPSENCEDVAGAIPDGLTVVAVSTFDEGLAAVTAIGEGRDVDLPSCG